MSDATGSFENQPVINTSWCNKMLPVMLHAFIPASLGNEEIITHCLSASDSIW